jgi:hypothetical protein
MPKLAHLIYGVIKSEQLFDANFNHSALAIQDGICPRFYEIRARFCDVTFHLLI